MGLGEVEREYVLVDVEQAGEHRVAMLVKGESAVVIEQTCGPDTEAAYGAPTHTHKVMVGWEACARALGVRAEDVVPALLSFFGDVRDPALLSDLMDVLDQAGEHYTYVAWSGEGDAVFRA